MNTESLKHHLATKVMGWKLVEDDEPYPFDSGRIYQSVDQGVKSTMFVSAWNPRGNIEQAMGCAKAIPDTTFVVESLVVTWANEKPFGAAIRAAERIETLAVAQGDSESEALSLACAKATGWKE